MLVKELYIPIVYSLRNGLPDLMWRTSFDHVQRRPSILGFGSRARAHEQGVLQLAL